VSPSVNQLMEEEVMFKSIKRLLVAVTAILALSAPSVALAYIRVDSGGSLTSGNASRASVASAVQPAGPSAQAGFQWGDAGIGGAGVLALVGLGAGATVVVRRRVREPVAG